MVDADLFQSTTFIKTLLDSLPCGFLLLDKEGRVRLVNNILDRILKVNKKPLSGRVPAIRWDVCTQTLTPWGAASGNAAITVKYKS